MRIEKREREAAVACSEATIGQSRDMGQLLTGTTFSALSSLNTSREDRDYTPESRYTRGRVLAGQPEPVSPPSGWWRINITYTLREAKRNVEQPTGEVTSWQTVSMRPREKYKITSRGWRAVADLTVCHGWIT